MKTPEMQSFDTHKYVKEFTKSGLKEAQAEAIVRSLLESRDYDFSKIATKEQIALIEKDIEIIKQDIDIIKQDMSKFATKAQVNDMDKRITGQLDAIEQKLTSKLDARENTFLKWIIPLFFTTWAMMIGIAFKLLVH